ncbi:MAG: hypothetical protein ACQEVA_20860 [Myxococcota bacterium]
MPSSRSSFLLIALTLGAILAPAGALAITPEFGVEVEAGRGTGLSPYMRNEVFTEVDRSSTDGEGRFLLTPFLADRRSGSGAAFQLRLVGGRIAAGLSLRTYALEQWRIHHRGTDQITQERIRPDGTIDDSGVDYVELEAPLDRPASESEQSTLFEIGLGANYRFVWPGQTVDFFVPVGGKLVLMHEAKRLGLYRLGLQATSGAGVAFDFVPNLSFLMVGRVHALTTTHYGRRSDAARRAVEVDESTESALFSTMLSASINLGLQFRIR